MVIQTMFCLNGTCHCILHSCKPTDSWYSCTAIRFEAAVGPLMQTRVSYLPNSQYNPFDLKRICQTRSSKKHHLGCYWTQKRRSALFQLTITSHSPTALSTTQLLGSRVTFILGYWSPTCVLYNRAKNMPLRSALNMETQGRATRNVVEIHGNRRRSTSIQG